MNVYVFVDFVIICLIFIFMFSLVKFFFKRSFVFFSLDLNINEI